MQIKRKFVPLLMFAILILSGVALGLELGTTTKSYSTTTTTSGQVTEIKVHPDSRGNAQVFITDRFNAYAFKWPVDSDFLYSWNGDYFIPPAEFVDAHGEEDNFSEISFLKSGSHQIQFRNVTASDITLILFDTTELGSDSDLIRGVNAQEQATQSDPGRIVNRDSGTDYSRLNIVTRAEWGADEALMSWTPEYWPVDKAIVHHTVWTDESNFPSVVRAIYLYHAVTLGWGDIGYNYLIDPNGNIYEGRAGGSEAIGAHAYSHNAGAVGISMIGNFSTTLPTSTARVKLRELLVERSLIHNFDLAWGTTVFGHRDMSKNNTACPGQALYNRLPNLVDIAQTEREVALLENPIATVKAKTELDLATYPDVRLRFVPANSELSTAELAALIPNNSGISQVLSISPTAIDIAVESYSGYYGSWTDHTTSRVKALHTMFLLDPEFSDVQLLTDLRLLSSRPSNQGFYLSRDDLYFEFSRPFYKGLGTIEVYNFDDDSLVEQVDVTSDQVAKTAARRMRVNLSQDLIEGKYYILICPTCISDYSGLPLQGNDSKGELVFSINKPHPGVADYDEDGLTDITYIREDNLIRLDFSNDGYDDWDLSLRSYGGDVEFVSADYDGDGLTDYSIREKTGIWRIDYSSNGFGTFDFNKSGYGGSWAQPLPADYDGDGKTDIAYRTSQKMVYIDYAANGFTGSDIQVPNSGTIYTQLVSADYDGDGNADLANRTLGGVWSINYAADGFTDDYDEVITGMGAQFANVVPADYDGDGKVDPAFRTNRGVWCIDYAANGLGAKDICKDGYGADRFQPQPADYDGDGKADVAGRDMYGRWYIDFADNGFTGVDVSYNGFGGAYASVYVGDYDGDGKSDPASRTLDGTWLIDLSSVNGFDGDVTQFKDRLGQLASPVVGNFLDANISTVSVLDNVGFWNIFDPVGGTQKSIYGYNKYIKFGGDLDGDSVADIFIITLTKDLLIDYSVNGLGKWDELIEDYDYLGKDASADYDGDGKTDIAGFDKTFYKIDYAANGFGAWDEKLDFLTGYQVVLPGDFDGDGKFDVAVKNNLGEIAIDLAGNGFGVVDLTLTGRGDNTLKVKSMDYDGDRKFDISGLDRRGVWRIDYASNGLGSWDAEFTGYGTNVTVINGDFDGDSLADLTVLEGKRWLLDFASNGFGNWDSSYWLNL